MSVSYVKELILKEFRKLKTNTTPNDYGLYLRSAGNGAKKKKILKILKKKNLNFFKIVAIRYQQFFG